MPLRTRWQTAPTSTGSVSDRTVWPRGAPFGHRDLQGCCFCYGQRAMVTLSGGRGAVGRPPLRLGLVLLRKGGNRGVRHLRTGCRELRRSSKAQGANAPCRLG